ncbi:MAG: hypothetical protein OEZ44_02935 [Candidatus Bathyarchaeota archaeon]|nr:hypothetical protein [Candidatus Bathyarchaeota archaeon]
MEGKIIKILQTLERASSPCPLGYIALHTNIVEPLKIMEALEREGYCRRCPTGDWSPSMSPMFEITTKARQELREVETSVLHVPLSVVAQTLARD